MGNSAGKPIEISEVLKFTDEPPAVAEVPNDSEIRKRLRDEGVCFSDDVSTKDLEKAFAIVSMGGFWRKHPQAHPNFNRVSNWLMVHEKYRGYLKDLLKIDDRAAATAAFEKWCGKLHGHSTFEDEQLFKFFRENMEDKIEDLKDGLDTLQNQHESAEPDEQEIFKKLKSGEEWKPSLQIYVEEMIKHMDLEEITLVSPWLHLTDEEYKTYRGYLSWLYSPMY